MLYNSVVFCVPHNHSFKTTQYATSFPAREKEYTQNNTLISKEAKHDISEDFVPL
jgi:hypothetical protein